MTNLLILKRNLFSAAASKGLSQALRFDIAKRLVYILSTMTNEQHQEQIDRSEHEYNENLCPCCEQSPCGCNLLPGESHDGCMDRARSEAARILGRIGGSRKSAAKTAAARKNAHKPRKLSEDGKIEKRDGWTRGDPE